MRESRETQARKLHNAIHLPGCLCGAGTEMIDVDFRCVKVNKEIEAIIAALQEENDQST